MGRSLRTENPEPRNHYDVVVIGGGLAGLSLVRQLQLTSDKNILLIERQVEIPPTRQKVGEATVQLSGYYFSKVLDLEEYLLRDHYMKYNLRFCWKSAGRDNNNYEDYNQSYIRNLSNIASYQLDRNKLEAELLRLNRADEDFNVALGTSRLKVSLAESGPHTVNFTHAGEDRQVTAEWVVDTTGRNRVLAKQLDLKQSSPIRHGAYFFWVDGLVNVEKLTSRSPREIRLAKERSSIGHLPFWLATNHFAGEGFWLWVIPLQGRTSFGLVFDRETFDADRVSSPDKLVAWICEEFPLFARDLPHRKPIDFSGFKNVSHDCVQTINPSKWALAGEAGRFSDPLYSPGGDLIAIHNTLIAAAITADDDSELESKCRLYEQMTRAVYQAYVPTFSVSYDALGDQEVFSLKYSWELTVYFAGYVFPFINDLFTDRRFLLAFMRLFSQLGPINKAVQGFLSAFFQWKKTTIAPRQEPLHFDFMEIGMLREAEKTFYKVGIEVDEAKRILGRQVANLEELARFIGAHVASVVLDDQRVLTNRTFVEGIDIQTLEFDTQEMRQRYKACADDEDLYPWPFDPYVFERFRVDEERLTPSADAESPELLEMAG